jgi:hypothetical protein
MPRRPPASRHVQFSAYGIHHDLAALAIRAADVKMAFSMLRELPRHWLEWYDIHAITFPLVTKAMTSGFCFTLGDLCAQGIAGKNLSTVDLGRSARSGAAGLIYHGPMAHYWLNFLDKSLSFGGAWWAALPKVAADQGPMAVLDNTFYSLLTGALAFRDPREVLRDVRANFKPGFMANLRFWPMVHFVTFTMVPIELQVLWEDSADIVWICILSTLNNEDGSEALLDEVQDQISKDVAAASLDVVDKSRMGGATQMGYSKQRDGYDS